jgi:hypothetical protein
LRRVAQAVQRWVSRPIVIGRGPSGLRQRRLPYLFDTGHFAMETHLADIAPLIVDFLDRLPDSE